ncbi:MAG: PqqD family protein [Thermoproteota archaeon]|nr:PqqD family peptide modification chaperone [Candidatus Brockarchaeota archaeon]
MWPFKKKEKTVSRERFLNAIPIRNPIIKWETSDDNTVTLIISRSPDAVSTFVQKMFTLPGEKKVKLDEIGSKVWLKVDGKSNMQDLIKWFSEEFRVAQREAEVSLSLFFKELSKRGFLTLLVPLPSPGTPEAIEEIEELKSQLKAVEKEFKKGKINEEQFNQIKKTLEEKIEYLKGIPEQK